MPMAVGVGITVKMALVRLLLSVCELLGAVSGEFVLVLKLCAVVKVPFFQSSPYKILTNLHRYFGPTLFL